MANVVFMGTPDFAVASLNKLVEGGHKPIAVVTQPDRRKGRGRRLSGTSVKEAAIRHDVQHILQPESVKDAAFAEQMAELMPDVIVVVAFSILPPPVYQTARLGAFNLHASLLPQYRGAAPVHRAVMAGEKNTGVTTFFLKEKVDTGHIIMQRALSIGENDTTGDVLDRMMIVGADVVLETLNLILTDQATTSAQDDSLATPAPKIHREECRVQWESEFESLHNFIRGLSPYPGAWTRHGDIELKLFRSRRGGGVTLRANDAPGSIVRTDGGIWVAGTDGTVEILELQQEGRKRMNAVDFLRGYTLRPGDRLL